MIIADELYGEFTIEEVLNELLLSEPVQRLKGIHQGGASYLVNPKWNVTRYEHSIGVMLLIRRLGGTIEEQMAGLLHDVSHTAFSHVIDFVFDNKEEDYHEKIFQNVLLDSEIPRILERYGYDYKNILLDDSRWTLLEQPAPELCADRVDYTLRDMYIYEQVTMDEVQDFLDQLIVIDGKMYVDSVPAAEWFVETYYKEVIDFFMDPLNIYGYDRLAKTLKLALDKKIIALDDLLRTDEEVMTLLRSTDNKEIQEILQQLHEKVKVVEDDAHYDVHRKNKLRLIDPSVWHNEQLIKSSSLSERVKTMGEEAYHKARKGMFVRVVSLSGSG